jgi:hypothetical protein
MLDGDDTMIIKSENSELEISIGTDVYLGSSATGQIFKKWDEFEDNQKVRLEIILKKVEELIFESEKMLLEAQATNTEDQTHHAVSVKHPN